MLVSIGQVIGHEHHLENDLWQNLVSLYGCVETAEQ